MVTSATSLSRTSSNHIGDSVHHSLTPSINFLFWFSPEPYKFRLKFTFSLCPHSWDVSLPGPAFWGLLDCFLILCVLCQPPSLRHLLQHQQLGHAFCHMLGFNSSFFFLGVFSSLSSILHPLSRRHLHYFLIIHALL